MFHQGLGSVFDTRSFNLYGQLGHGYDTLGLGNE